MMYFFSFWKKKTDKNTHEKGSLPVLEVNKPEAPVDGPCIVDSMTNRNCFWSILPVFYNGLHEEVSYFCDYLSQN